MSYSIIYDQAALKLSLKDAYKAMVGLVPALADDMYLQAKMDGTVTLAFCEDGCSNTFEFDGRPARNWNLVFRGQRAMCQVVDYAVDVESGSLRPGGREVKAETFIASWRKRLAEARVADIGSMPVLKAKFAGAPAEDHSHSWTRLSQSPFGKFLIDTGYLVLHTWEEYGHSYTSPVLTIPYHAPEPTKLAVMGWLLHTYDGRTHGKYGNVWQFHLDCSELDGWIAQQRSGSQLSLIA